MRKLVEKYSSKIVVTVITIISILGTQIIVRIYYFLTGTEMRLSEQIVGIIAPLLVASFVVTYLIRLIKKLNELEKEMRNIANIDPVTNLKTRRALFESAEDLFQLSRRYNRTLGVLLVDVDKFKIINDTYGHIQGDMILLTLGSILNELKRDSDLAGRYGGDEMLVFLPETDIVGCREFAEKLINEVNSKEFLYADNLIRFTTSIGISVMDESSDFSTLKSLVDSADQALYHSKGTGKNKYCENQKKEQFM